MTVEQSKIDFYTKKLDELRMSSRIRNMFLRNLKDPYSTEESFLAFVKDYLGWNPFVTVETPAEHAIKALAIQTNNKIEQINMALSQANNLINNQNEQLAASYIKIAVLEEKNEQLWNLVCQSKLIDCSNIITGQVLNEEGEL